MKLIILNVVPYKENDAIVTALSEEKLITFNARGILKASSKNVAINNPLIVADIELSESKSKFLTLKSSCVILSPYTLDIDLEKMAIIHMMQECINKILQDEEKIEIFKPLFSAINALKVDKLNPLQIFISFLCTDVRNMRSHISYIC